MSSEPTRAEIEAAKEEWLDKLSFAKARRRQVALAAALPGGDQVALAAADESVRSIELMLEGLGYGLEQVAAREAATVEAERLAERREAAVDVLATMSERANEISALDDDLKRVREKRERIEVLTGRIQLAVSDWFPNGIRGEESRNNFLMAIGAYGLTDVAARARKDLGEDFGNYSRFLTFGRAGALRALATVIPEVEDEDVQAEARARIKNNGGDDEAGLSVAA